MAGRECEYGLGACGLTGENCVIQATVSQQDREGRKQTVEGLSDPYSPKGPFWYRKDWRRYLKRNRSLADSEGCLKAGKLKRVFGRTTRRKNRRGELV